MVSKLKILKNKEQRRAVSTAEFIRNLLLKEANESWPVAQSAAERCARSRRQGARHSRERGTAGSAQRGSLGAGTAAQPQGQTRVTAGRVPVVKRVTQDANAAVQSTVCSRVNFWRGMWRWPSHWAIQLHHRFSYLCHKPWGDTTHKGRSFCHTNLIPKN